MAEKVRKLIEYNAKNPPVEINLEYRARPLAPSKAMENSEHNRFLEDWEA